MFPILQIDEGKTYYLELTINDRDLQLILRDLSTQNKTTLTTSDTDPDTDNAITGDHEGLNGWLGLTTDIVCFCDFRVDRYK